MFPYLRSGDRLIVKRRDFTSVKTGNIILFKNQQLSPEHGLTAHRVIRIISNTEFITKGDNLISNDPGVRRVDEIVGRVVMLVRRNRILPLTIGLYGWLGKLMAFCSKRNFTPGIIVSRLKLVKGIVFLL